MPAWLSTDVLEIAAVSSRSSRSPYDEDKSRRAKAAPVPVPGLLLVETVPVGNAVLSERNSSPSSSVSLTSTSSCRWTLLPDPGNNCILLHHIVCCPTVLRSDRHCRNLSAFYVWGELCVSSITFKPYYYEKEYFLVLLMFFLLSLTASNIKYCWCVIAILSSGQPLLPRHKPYDRAVVHAVLHVAAQDSFTAPAGQSK